jgi:hypothetical protein
VKEVIRNLRVAEGAYRVSALVGGWGWAKWKQRDDEPLASAAALHRKNDDQKKTDDKPDKDRNQTINQDLSVKKSKDEFPRKRSEFNVGKCTNRCGLV